MDTKLNKWQNLKKVWNTVLTDKNIASIILSHSNRSFAYETALSIADGYSQEEFEAFIMASHMFYLNIKEFGRIMALAEDDPKLAKKISLVTKDDEYYSACKDFTHLTDCEFTSMSQALKIFE